MIWTGLALGFLLGCIYYKHISGIADVEAEAFVNGYAEGYYDGEQHRTQKYTIWDGPSWRKNTTTGTGQPRAGDFLFEVKR